MRRQFLFKTMIPAVLLGGILTFTSCEDKFSEEDFLNKQHELAEKKSAADHARELALIAAKAEDQTELLKLQQTIAKETREEFKKAYEEAGLLVKGNIVVLDAVTSKPVSGAKVTFFGKEVTANEQGVANFEGIAIGGGDIKVSATNYYNATSPAVITYLTPATSGQGGLPIQRTVVATLRMVAEGSITESSVTVKGKVSMDSNIANATTEVPQNITVNIDYAVALSPNTTQSRGFSIVSYQLDNPDFKPAKVDNTTGEYTIAVPAIAGIRLMVPEIEQDFTYIIKNPEYDATTNPDVDEYILKTVPATFKTTGATEYPSDRENRSTSDLYKYEFSKLQGSGFDLKFKQLFETNLYRNYTPVNNAWSLSFTPGAGYKAIPTVKMTAKGSDKINDDKIYMTTSVEYVADKKFTITGGKNLTDGSYYNIILKYVDNNGMDNTAYLGSTTVKVVGTKITFENINSYNSTVSNVHNIKGFELEGLATANQPTIKRAINKVTVDGVNIVKATGTDKKPGVYTAWPTVTFTGGSAVTPAAFKFQANRGTQWEVSIANKGTNYDVLPEVKYTNSISNDILDVEDSFRNSLKNSLQLNTAGTISFKGGRTTLRTKFYAPNHIKTVVEDKLPNDGKGASVQLSFTNHTDKNNDITAVSYVGNYDYKKKPTHKMIKTYAWVTDPKNPLELNVKYYGEVPTSVTQKPNTGKGYMNPQPQTDKAGDYSINSSDKGKTITYNFMYGVGKVKNN